MKNCETCNIEFQPRKDSIEKGMGIYCSVQCAGVSKRKGNDIPIETLKNMYETMGYKAIAKKLSMNYKNVMKRLKEAGVKSRKNTQDIEPKQYRTVKAPYGHQNARANGMIKEHILIASQMIGRPIMKEEVVHHINMDKKDNCPENLAVLSRARHARHHGQINRLIAELMEKGIIEYTVKNGYQVK